MTSGAFLTLLTLLAVDGGVPAQPLARCTDNPHFDGGPRMGRSRVLWSRLRRPRLEILQLLDTGMIWFGVDIEDGKVVFCQGQLTQERLARFLADMARVSVCPIRSVPTSSKEENYDLLVDLEGPQECAVKLPAARWLATPQTRAAQRLIDALRRDLCGGRCPFP